MRRAVLCAAVCMAAIGCASTDQGVMPMPSEIPPSLSATPSSAIQSKPVRHVPVRRVEHGAVIFRYEPNRTYSVQTTAKRVTAIHLAPGERVASDPFLGDPGMEDDLQWEQRDAISGGSTVVVIRPARSGLATNIVIPGTRHTYVLNVKSSDRPSLPIVRFDFPDDEIAGAAPPQPDIVIPAFDPAAIDRNFSLSGDRPAWAPVSVFALGERTYIEFPDLPGRIGAPALFAIEAKTGTAKPVQFIVSGKFYEFSTRFHVAELRGNGATVKIMRAR